MKDNNSQKLRTEINNLAGYLLTTNVHSTYQGGIIPISLINIGSGIYLLKVYENERFNVIKLKVE